MVQPGLRRCYATNEAHRDIERDNIKSNEDNNRFMKKILKENADEDYFEYLKLYYFYNVDSLAYSNECGSDWFNDEDEDEDEADPQHKMFDGNTEGFEIDEADEADPQHKMFDGNTEGFEIGDEDEADPQYKMFLANAKPDGRSYVVNVDTEDGSPVLIKYEKECGCNYLCESSRCKKMKSIKMQKNAVKEKTSINSSSKDEADRQRLSRTVRGFDNSRSAGDADMIYEPLDPVKNGIMNRKLSMVKSGASKRQGKRRTKIKSGDKPVIEKGSKPVKITVKKEASDADEDYASFLCKNIGLSFLSQKKNIGLSFENEAAEDDVEILDISSPMLKNVGIVNAEDRCPQMSVWSEFREKVMDLLKKPYDSNEYKELSAVVNKRKLMGRYMDLRSGGGKDYKSTREGKSYLDHYEALKEKLEEVDSKRKKLNILRGFIFWLKNVSHEDAFAPWTDAEFLALVDKSS